MGVVLGILMLPGLAGEMPGPPVEGYVRGYASAYAPGVMEATVRYRLDNDVWRIEPPIDWYTAVGYVATNDCSQVGGMATLVAPDGRGYRVLVADCGGADGGAEWMTRHNIVVELDWRLWEVLTARHGRPLAVELRGDDGHGCGGDAEAASCGVGVGAAGGVAEER